MTTSSVHSATPQLTFWERIKKEPPFAAFWLLRVGFIVLPLWMGIDKFFNVLTYWPDYLAPWIANLSPFSPEATMHIVGVIEIIAGIAIAIKARYAAFIVAAWLAGIVINLVTYPTSFDVALRDFGLLVAALSLALLARTYDPPFGSSKN